MGFFTRVFARMAFVASMAGAPGCVMYHHSSRMISTDGVGMTATDDNGKRTMSVGGSCASDVGAWAKIRGLLQEQCTNGDSFKSAPSGLCVNGLFRAEVEECTLRRSTRPRLETQLDIPLHRQR